MITSCPSSMFKNSQKCSNIYKPCFVREALRGVVFEFSCPNNRVNESELLEPRRGEYVPFIEPFCFGVGGVHKTWKISLDGLLTLSKKQIISENSSYSIHLYFSTRRPFNYFVWFLTRIDFQLVLATHLQFIVNITLYSGLWSFG